MTEEQFEYFLKLVKSIEVGIYAIVGAIIVLILTLVLK